MSVCGLLNTAFGKAVSYFQNLDFLKSLNIFKIEEQCVWLDLAGKYKLHGVALEGASNHEMIFDEFEHFAEDLKYSDKGEAFVTYVRNCIKIT